jgi:Bacterial SH3 domain
MIGNLARSLGAAAAGLILCAHGSIEAGQVRPKMSVLVGGEEKSEGCAGTAVVTVRRLNVRSGPGTTHAIIAHLTRGQSVSVCRRLSGGWVGIVIHSQDGPRDCRLSDAGPRQKAYTGPCDSGWVSEQYLQLQAG